MICVILIDPHVESVSETLIEPTLDGLYALLQTDVVERVPLQLDHWLYLDEEGALKRDNPAFKIKNWLFVGRAAVVMMQNEKLRSNELKLPEFRKLISFPKIVTTSEFGSTTVRESPGLGTVIEQGSVKFKPRADR